jgi:hypothetical protein
MKSQSIAAPLLLALLFACGGTQITFDMVSAEWVLDSLIVRYRSTSQVIATEPVRLSMAKELVTTGKDIAAIPGVRVDHYVVSRDSNGALVQEPPFPKLTKGTIHFQKAETAVGKPVIGDFFLYFLDGNTLNGSFDTRAVDPNAPASK